MPQKVLVSIQYKVYGQVWVDAPARVIESDAAARQFAEEHVANMKTEEVIELLDKTPVAWSLEVEDGAGHLEPVWED